MDNLFFINSRKGNGITQYSTIPFLLYSPVGALLTLLMFITSLRLRDYFNFIITLVKNEGRKYIKNV